MSNTYKLVVRDGAVYVLGTFAMTDEPTIVYHFYPTTIEPRTLRACGLDSGVALTRDNTAPRGGRFTIPNGDFGRRFVVDLTEGGQTKAAHTERVSAPGPDARKVRRREIRWYMGAWQVLSARKGWVVL